MSRVLLFSGGLDSVALWHLVGRPPAVYVRLGHRYENEEVRTIRELEATVPGLRVDITSGPLIGQYEAPGGHIPHRNLTLIACAAAHYAGADEILLGALLGEASPDKSRRFLRATSAALSASEHRRVRVSAPAHRWTKTGLLRRFLAAEPRAAEIIACTRSCYSPGGQECGQCQACFRRSVALYHCGLTDRRPTPPPGADPWSALRSAGVTRWGSLGWNNALAGLAMAGVRIGRGA